MRNGWEGWMKSTKSFLHWLDLSAREYIPEEGPGKWDVLRYHQLRRAESCRIREEMVMERTPLQN